MDEIKTEVVALVERFEKLKTAYETNKAYINVYQSDIALLESKTEALRKEMDKLFFNVKKLGTEVQSLRGEMLAKVGHADNYVDESLVAADALLVKRNEMMKSYSERLIVHDDLVKQVEELESLKKILSEAVSVEL